MMSVIVIIFYILYIVAHNIWPIWNLLDGKYVRLKHDFCCVWHISTLCIS